MNFKRLVVVLILVVLLSGCTTHINQVKDRWGPPAKVEERADTVVYYYYFYKTKVVRRPYMPPEVMKGWVVVEITTDLDGKILKKRKYWKQPTVTVANLNLNMTRTEVISTIGQPTADRGSIVNKKGQVIEVWEYALYKTNEDALYRSPSLYWLYFYKDRLVQWSEADDWQREADRIYEMTFR